MSLTCRRNFMTDFISYLARRAGLLAAIVWLLAFPGANSARAAEGYRLEMDYELYVGGFLLGRAGFQIQLGNRDYRIDAQGRSEGLIDRIVGFRSQASSQGQVLEGWPLPTLHRQDNSWFGEPRSVRLGFAAAGPQRIEVLPEAVDDDRQPVPGDLLGGSMDPLSAALLAGIKMMPESAATPCRFVLPIFDGRRRYDITFKPERWESIEGPFFKGRAQRCSALTRRIAGFSQNPWLPRTEEPEAGHVWFTRMAPATPPIVVRLEADIGLGSLVVHLVRFARK
jgi:hypothetical protein